MDLPSKIDRFNILKILGKGSQGLVYLAMDPQLERRVAIKTLHKGFLKHDDKKERLIQEAKTVSKLQHPNIVPLFEAGNHGDLFYLVFEYVDGTTIKEYLNKKGPFVIHQAIKMMIQILDGINCAHKQGVIHRDLSPSNILIDNNGMPRIMDFGISVNLASNEKQGKDIAGTPIYMSPEHLKEGSLCIQSDIFSLGLIFYEMIVGQHAIQVDNDFAVMYKIANETIDHPSLKNNSIDTKLDNIVLKAVERHLDSRYSNAIELKKDLEEYLKDDETEDEEPIDSAKTHSTVDFLLRKIRHKSDFPTFSNNIMEINKKASASRMNYSSASELANAVLKDYSLTNKLLKLVNSAFYGQFAGKITTVSRAVVVLGFEQVSMAASSLMLFEHLGNKNQKEELRESAISSFMSGLIAKDLSDKMRLPATEEAFICSMFHNLGKHLVLFYFEEEHHQIKDLVERKGITEETAAKAVLGVNYEELGRGIAKAWHFPKKIINSMQSIPKGRAEKPKTEESMLKYLSGFSNELCLLINSDEGDENNDSLNALLKRYKDCFPLSKKQIKSLLKSSKEKVEEYSGIYNVNLKKSRFIKNLDEYSKDQAKKVSAVQVEKHEDQKTIEVETDHYRDIEIDDIKPVTSEISDPQTILINGIQDITNTLLEDFELNDVLTMILETMYRGFAFNRILFCILNPKTKEINARIGLGKDIDRITSEFGFKMNGNPDVFHFALHQSKDVGIDDATDPQFKKRLPEWYLEKIDAPAFILYPIIVNKRPVGLIYADRELPGRVISGNQSNYMKTLCNQAVLAIKQSR